MHQSRFGRELGLINMWGRCRKLARDYRLAWGETNNPVANAIHVLLARRKDLRASTVPMEHKEEWLRALDLALDKPVRIEPEQPSTITPSAHVCTMVKRRPDAPAIVLIAEEIPHT